MSAFKLVSQNENVKKKNEKYWIRPILIDIYLPKYTIKSTVITNYVWNPIKLSCIHDFTFVNINIKKINLFSSKKWLLFWQILLFILTKLRS